MNDRVSTKWHIFSPQDNATRTITAMPLDKNNYHYHRKYANKLFKLGKYKRAEKHYKKALEICINKNGKEHIQTVKIYHAYGKFYSFFGKNSKAKRYFYAAFQLLRKIKGDNDLKTKSYKNYFGKILIMMKQYDEAINYLSSPFAIVSEEEEIFVLLDYNEETMIAPEIILFETGLSVNELLEIAQNNDMPKIDEHHLATGLMNDCHLFEPVLPEYYERLAEILAKIAGRE